jgi:hypothetical protein
MKVLHTQPPEHKPAQWTAEALEERQVSRKRLPAVRQLETL